MARKIDGQLSANGIRFALVVGRFNSFITDHLVKGAIDALTRHGASEQQITIINVPGAFEIPLACKKAALSGDYDAIVALGAVIRGSTSHYDHVCNAVSSGIAQATLETTVPIAFGVVTTDTIEQAIERAGCKAGNKGADAALAAVEMVNLIKDIERPKR